MQITPFVPLGVACWLQGPDQEPAELEHIWEHEYDRLGWCYGLQIVEDDGEAETLYLCQFPNSPQGWEVELQSDGTRLVLARPRIPSKAEQLEAQAQQGGLVAGPGGDLGAALERKMRRR